MLIRPAASQVNFDFEATPAGTYTAANAVSGWTVSSRQNSVCNIAGSWSPGSAEFRVISTPATGLPYLGTLSHSPLGGTRVCSLNNLTANHSSTRLTHEMVVNYGNHDLRFAYAGVLESGSHNSCCEEASFSITLRDSAGALLNCQRLSFVSSSCLGSSGFTNTSGAVVSGWQEYSQELMSYIGQNIVVEISSIDCSCGAHAATLFVDASCTNYHQLCNCSTNQLASEISFCPGSNTALVTTRGYDNVFWQGPPGYSLSAAQATLSQITITNAVVGNVYTMTALTAWGCSVVNTYTLSYSTVGLSGLASSTTCVNGTSGSATVYPTGSAQGYSYSWIDVNNVTIGTDSVISGLTAGNYSIFVSVPGYSACGTTSGVVTVLSGGTRVFHEIKPYCGSEYVLCAPQGTNYSWYLNNTLVGISSAQCYTLFLTGQNTFYRITYDSPNGCRDSINYALISSPPGSLSIVYNKLVCPGSVNGQVVFSVSPSSALSGSMFSILNIGNTPSFTGVSGGSATSGFTFSGLAANGSYSVRVFDGLCIYSQTFTVPQHVFSFTPSPMQTVLCPGSSVVATANFPVSSENNYTYSWSPNAFLSPSANLQAVAITPTAAAGTTVSLIYSVTVTPKIVNCPLTKTISVQVVHPPTPTVSPPGTMCVSGSTLQISASPSGATFAANGGVSPGGIIVPQNCSPGLNTFTCTTGSHTCISTTTGSFYIGGPVLSVNESTICRGSSVTLVATGASNYTWSTGALTPTTMVSPTIQSQYIVHGSHAADNCIATRSVLVHVQKTPTISVSGSGTVCAGSAATLTASGATSFTWSTGSVASSVVVTPAAMKHFSVIGTGSANSCTAHAVKTVSTIQNPPVSLFGDLLLCMGQTGFVYAIGADSFRWSTGVTGSVVSVHPGTSSIVVTGTNAVTTCTYFAAATVSVVSCNGISEKSEAEVSVYPNPFVSHLSISLASGSTAVLTNSAGQQIQKLILKPGHNHVETAELRPGIYYLYVKEVNRVFKIICTNHAE